MMKRRGQNDFWSRELQVGQEEEMLLLKCEAKAPGALRFNYDKGVFKERTRDSERGSLRPAAGPLLVPIPEYAQGSKALKLGSY